jgi:head-tail adaptor
MTAGARDTIVIFEQRQTTQDPVYGTTIEGDWTEYCQAWAEVQDMLPSRSENVDETISIARRPARLRIDYLDGVGITSSMRVRIEADELFPERIMQIISGPAHKRDSDELEFVVEQMSTQGEAP